MVVEDEQLAVLAQRRRHPDRPAFEIVEAAEDALARIDEVEAAATQLARQRLRIAVHPQDLRPPLPRPLERSRPRVDARGDGPEVGQRGRRFARTAEEVEDALALQVAERALHERRQLHRLGAGPMRVFPGAQVFLGRLHLYAPSE